MIETQRLIIRPLQYEELKRHLLLPDEWAKQIGLKPSLSLMDKETREAILNDLLPYMDDPAKDPLFYTMWIVIEKSEQAIIGGICFHGEPDANGWVEVGYGTDEDYRNKGYMTEVLAGLMHWIQCFRKEVRVVMAETDSGNSSSIRVLEKNGFKAFQQGENLRFRLDLP
jgi:[ribosomal protein S5]-alanine N-acetyltransferase